ncbi:hypothetical protein HAX54_014885 [Datura stramonium]|uniref:Uncharacterized protein n=1 Tax=Datura stramonium TaxID=4076 RepID=A0ABS8Y6G3_DATST|nr:hypothetical protein [Datura stramonium]
MDSCMQVIGVDNILVVCGKQDKGWAKFGSMVEELECTGYGIKVGIMGLGRSCFSLHLLIWIDFWMRHGWNCGSERLWCRYIYWWHILRSRNSNVCRRYVLARLVILGEWGSLNKWRLRNIWSSEG